MDKNAVEQQLQMLHGIAEALRDTRLPVREKAAIARLLSLADSIEESKTKLEEAMGNDDGNHEQGGQLRRRMGGGQHGWGTSAGDAQTGGRETLPAGAGV